MQRPNTEEARRQSQATRHRALSSRLDAQTRASRSETGLEYNRDSETTFDGARAMSMVYFRINQPSMNTSRRAISASRLFLSRFFDSMDSSRPWTSRNVENSK